MFREVIEFNNLIGNTARGKPALMNEAETRWVHTALNEEADEFLEACELDSDLASAVDALIDSIYFGIGGLHRLGLTQDQMERCFAAVHNANMTKKRGIVASRPQDGSIVDAIKPEGWTDPKVLIGEIISGN